MYNTLRYANNDGIRLNMQILFDSIIHLSAIKLTLFPFLPRKTKSRVY